MGMRAFRSMVSCVLLLIVPVMLFAADSGAAMLYADGAAWLNGSHVPNSSAIFSGDLVQTRSDSAANIHAPGSTITVLGDSLVKFEGASLDIQHGGLSISTSRALFATAGSVRISPASKVWTEFNVIDIGGVVRIAARKGDLTITDDDGTTTLQQGQQTTRDDQSNQADDSKDNTKKDKKHRNGNNGAPAAASGGVFNSTAALAVGAGVGAGITVWVLSKSSNPVSPSNP
jgi:hypothetical protein